MNARRMIDLGTISERTQGAYYAGLYIDGARALNPASGLWVRLKTVPYPPIVDLVPGQ